MWHDRAGLVGGAAALALAVGSGLLVQQARPPHAALPTAPIGRLDEQGALDVGRALYREWTGLVMQPEAECFSVPGPGGRTRARWLVKGKALPAGPASHYVWDAETGDLLEGYANRQKAAPGAPVRSPADAAMRGWEWMERLGVAAQCSEWRLHEAPVFTSRGWETWWDGDDRWATVCLDEANGACLAVRTSHTYPFPLSRRGYESQARP